MHKKDLPVPCKLTFDRLFYQFLIEQGNDTFDGESFLRRRLYDAQISYVGKGHRECSWDRRRGEGNDVNPLFKFLYLLFLPDAEPVLFVDNEETEFMEAYLLAEQTMSSYYYVDITAGQCSDRIFLVLFWI